MGVAVEAIIADPSISVGGRVVGLHELILDRAGLVVVGHSQVAVGLRAENEQGACIRGRGPGHRTSHIHIHTVIMSLRGRHDVDRIVPSPIDGWGVSSRNRGRGRAVAKHHRVGVTRTRHVKTHHLEFVLAQRLDLERGWHQFRRGGIQKCGRHRGPDRASGCHRHTGRGVGR